MTMPGTRPGEYAIYPVPTGGNAYAAQPLFPARSLAIYNMTPVRIFVLADTGTEYSADPGTIWAMPIAPASVFTIRAEDDFTKQGGFAFVDFSSVVRGFVFSGEREPGQQRPLTFNNDTQEITINQSTNLITVMFTTLASMGNLTIAIVNPDNVVVATPISLVRLYTNAPLITFRIPVRLPRGYVVRITFTAVATVLVGY